MKRLTAILCTMAFLAPSVWGQAPKDDIAGNEFPGLQFLPPGSKVKGISLPRYEKHRVSALLMSEVMEVLSRSNVSFSTIRANMYAENGETTLVTCAKAAYDFRSKIVESETRTAVDSPRFSASGNGVTFSTENNIGLLKGPVRTTIKNSSFNLGGKKK